MSNPHQDVMPFFKTTFIANLERLLDLITEIFEEKLKRELVVRDTINIVDLVHSCTKLISYSFVADDTTERDYFASQPCYFVDPFKLRAVIVFNPLLDKHHTLPSTYIDMLKECYLFGHQAKGLV